MNPDNSRISPEPSSKETRKSWFEQNPKKSIVIILGTTLLALFSILLAIDKIIEAKARPHVYRPSIKRYIRLKEYNPFHTGFAYSPQRKNFADKIIHRIDENGFIMPSKIHDKPDLILAFLGGSTTECFSITEENRFPYLVGRLIERDTRLKVNAYNGAMAGNNSIHSLNILLNKVIPLNPNFVIMMHNINDLVILLYENSYWNNNKYKSPIVEFEPSLETLGANIQDTFHLVRNMLFPALYAQFKEWKKNLQRKDTRGRDLQDEFQPVRGRKIPIDQSRLQEEFRMNLQTFINICQARRITPVLMTQASRLKLNPDPDILEPIKAKLEKGQGISYEQFRELFEGFNQVIRETGAQNGVLVIDLANKVPQERDYLEDVVYFSEPGSIFVAHIVSQTVTAHLK